MTVEVRLIDRHTGRLLCRYGYTSLGRMQVRLALDALAADADGWLAQLDVDRLCVDVLVRPSWPATAAAWLRRRLWLA